MVWRYACGFFRILKLYFITGFLLQYLGNWYRTNAPLVNFTIFNTSNKNKAGDINSPWNLLVSSVSSVSFLFLCLPCPSLSSPLLSLLSLFSLSLGDDTKWPTKIDVSLNPNKIKFLDRLSPLRWDSSLLAISSGSILFAKLSVLVYRAERVNIGCIPLSCMSQRSW